MLVCTILSRAFMTLSRRNNNDNQCDNIHLLQIYKASSRCRRSEVQLLSIYWKREELLFLSKTVREKYLNPFAQKSETLRRIMSKNIVPSLMNLPVEFIYRILDQLAPLDILMSVWNVCTQLDPIIETYHRYQVKFTIRHGEDVRRYLFGICVCSTDITSRESPRFFLDNHHVGSQSRRIRWMESKTTS
jgi:hypothetical protein